jgi:hypothetical protein
MVVHRPTSTAGPPLPRAVHVSEVESIHKSNTTLIDRQDRQGEFDVEEKLGEPKQRHQQTERLQANLD